MKLPSKVQASCVKFLAAVRYEPAHDIKIEDRFSIYNSFGPSRIHHPSYTKGCGDFNHLDYFQYIKDEFLNSNINDYILSWLAVISARYVLPLVNRVWPQISEKGELVSPQQILEVAEKLLRKDITFDAAYEQFDEFYWSNEAVSKSATYDVACAFSSAYSALEFILYGLRSRPPFVNGSEIIGGDIFIFNALEAYNSIDRNSPGEYQVKESDVIIKDFLAFRIIENPPPGYQFSNEPIPIEYDVQKRLEFWEWWLTEAIPQAWELAQQSISS